MGFRHWTVAAGLIAAASAQAVWPFCSSKPALRQGDFVIATNGVATASILIPENASPTVKFAAGELSAYLAKITGGGFAVSDRPVGNLNTIRLGFPGVEGKRDTIELKVTNAQTMEVSGVGELAPIYAAYDLLETIGCRFWSCDYEQIPSTNCVVFKAGYAKRETPVMEYRVVSARHPTVRWGLQLRANAGEHLDGKLKKRFGYIAAKVQYNHNLCGGHKGAIPSAEPGKSLPRRDHPEWYSRGWDCKGNKDLYFWAICPTSKGLLDNAEKTAIEWFKDNPAETSISITPGDMGYYCCCDECNRLRRSDPSKAPSVLYVHFGNELARRLQKSCPGKKVVLLSYWSVSEPPTGKNVKLEPNFSIAFAELWRNHGRPVTSCERFTPKVEAWSRLSDNPMYYWDYYANFSNWEGIFPNWDIIGPAMRFYRDHHFAGGFAQMPLNTFCAFGDLNLYTFNRMAWNPDLDEKQIRKEWLEGCFGPAARFAKEIMDVAENGRDRQRWAWIGCYVRDTRHFLSAFDCIRIARAYDALWQTLRNDPERRLMAYKMRLGIYDLLAMRYNDILAVQKQCGYQLPPFRRLYDSVSEIFNSPAACVTGEWWGEFAGFDHFARIFAKQEPKPTEWSKRAARSIVVTPEELNANGKIVSIKKDEAGRSYAHFNAQDQDPMDNRFMNLESGCISWKKPAGETNVWHILSTVRVKTTVTNDPAAAYLVMYADQFANGLAVLGRGEFAHMRLDRDVGDFSWRTACLGKYVLPPGAQISVMAGFVNPTADTDSRGFVLLDPELLEKSVHDSDAVWSKYFDVRVWKPEGAKREHNGIDNYDYWRAAQGQKVVATIAKPDAGKAWVFLRARVGTEKPLLYKVAKVSVVKPYKEVRTVEASDYVSGSLGELAWNLICLGEVDLTEGMQIVVEPQEGDFVDVRDLVLVAPGIFDRAK